ncbi:MAG: ribosome maturation factor RimM [Demequina sp.]
MGRAHGLKGEVTVELHTDIPEGRFASGAVLATAPASAGPLTVARTRTQAGRWYVQFEQISTREAADVIRGVELVVEEDTSDEPDAWYLHELIGLRAERPTGEVVGEVVDLEHPPAHDLLVIKQPGGTRARIPFVESLVPQVDIAGGRVIVDPPHGLLAGEEPEATGETHGEA